MKTDDQIIELNFCKKLEGTGFNVFQVAQALDALRTALSEARADEREKVRQDIQRLGLLRMNDGYPPNSELEHAYRRGLRDVLQSLT